MRGMDLRHVKTCELVKELENREGVKKFLAEPHQIETITEEGPAIILIVTD